MILDSIPITSPALVSFARWWSGENNPLCLTCANGWPSLETSPPAAFAVVRTQEFFRQNGSEAAALSGICASCFSRSDLIQRCLDRYRDIWPDLQPINAPVHDAPSGVQRRNIKSIFLLCVLPSPVDPPMPASK